MKFVNYVDALRKFLLLPYNWAGELHSEDTHCIDKMSFPVTVKSWFSPGRRISYAEIIFVIIPLIAAALAIWDRREEAISSYQREMKNLGVVLAEQSARSMQAVDLVLQEIQAKALADGIDTPERFKQVMATEDLHRFLIQRLANLPQADLIALLDTEGKLVNGSRFWPVPIADFSYRDYFIYLREHDEPGLFVSSPGRSQFKGNWLFFLAHRVNGPSGEFLGVVVGAIEVQYFEEFYHAITLQGGGAVTVFRRDGTMLARYPHVEQMMGEKLAPQAPFYALVAQGGGVSRTLGYVDGLSRVVSVHPVRDYPLVVALTIAEGAALADWRYQSIFIAIAAVCAAVGFALLFRALAARSRSLSDSEARFRDFALTTSDWFWETDRDHRFTYVSDGIRAFGQDPSSRIGRTRIELAADLESERDKWQEHLAVQDRHEPFRDFVYTRKLGTQPEHTVAVSGKPFFDRSGQFLGYRGTVRDVTEKYLAERCLIEAKLAAEEANLAKSQFLANMSHELRTPLNAILGFSEMLALGTAGPLQPNQKEYAWLIHKSGDHLLEIINDVLDLAKIDAGKLGTEEEPVDPTRIVSACLNIVEESAHASDLHLSVEAEARMPLLYADARRLRQILLNLLSNAIKFSQPGGSIVVAVRRTEDGSVAFDVRDTGPGMTEAEIDIATQAFGQVDAGLNRRHEGTGLGLPLARSLAELHGGSLQIDSEKGRGTTVTVVFPVTRVLADLSNSPPILERFPAA